MGVFGDGFNWRILPMAIVLLVKDTVDAVVQKVKGKK